MHIQLIRYYQTPDETKSRMLVDGEPFGEARETGTMAATLPHRLDTGAYTCRCAPSEFSPMTLRVVRTAGYRLMQFAWDPLRQHRAGYILVGQGNQSRPPEKRRLTLQQMTFELLTQRLYRAYAQGEDVTLTIADEESQTDTNPNPQENELSEFACIP